MKKINFGSHKDFETRAVNLKKIMIELNIADPNLIKGCNHQEIMQLEQENNVLFPQSYKVFLKHFGHGLGGRVMNDIDILYEDISGLTNLLRDEVLIEDGDPVLPKKAFVFSARYGEQFMFFDTNRVQSEPAIFYYIENAQNFSQVGDSIFDVLEEEIQLAYTLKLKSEKIREETKKIKEEAKKRKENS
ncbi:MAG: SMI1/KNR4 family protein [Cyanobacteria bacterium P01_G01_bin.39]